MDAKLNKINYSSFTNAKAFHSAIEIIQNRVAKENTSRTKNKS